MKSPIWESGRLQSGGLECRFTDCGIEDKLFHLGFYSGVLDSGVYISIYGFRIYEDPVTSLGIYFEAPLTSGGLLEASRSLGLQSGV